MQSHQLSGGIGPCLISQCHLHDLHTSLSPSFASSPPSSPSLVYKALFLTPNTVPDLCMGGWFQVGDQKGLAKVSQEGWEVWGKKAFQGKPLKSVTLGEKYFDCSVIFVLWITVSSSGPMKVIIWLHYEVWMYYPLTGRVLKALCCTWTTFPRVSLQQWLFAEYLKIMKWPSKWCISPEIRDLSEHTGSK